MNENFPENARAHAQHHRRKNRGQKASRAGGGKPGKRVRGGVWRRLGHDRRHTQNLVVQRGPVHDDVPRVEPRRHRPHTPQQDDHHQQQIRAPGGQQLRCAMARRRDEAMADVLGVEHEIILVTCTPTVFRMKNSVTPNASPHRIAAGRTPFRPFHPHITSNRYDGTITESGARIHAVAALKWSSGRPVVAASVTIGMPSEPNATGAVLAIRAMAAAENGENPSPASIAAAIAIGVPKPAAPSMKAPKANAIKMACNLRSSVKWPTESLIISNLPLSTIT